MGGTRIPLRSRLLASLVFLTGSSAVVGCSNGGAGGAAGDIAIMCSAAEDLCRELTTTFAKETGISATYVRISTGEGVARLRADANNPTFDVWYGGPSLGAATAALDGLIEPYVSPNAEAIPTKFRSSDGMWTGIYLGVLGFCSNRAYVNSIGAYVPTSYDDLLNPAFDDSIAMADQRTSGTAATAGANLVALFGSDDAALDYLKALHPNIYQYTRTGATPSSMVALGETAVAVVFAHDCLKFEIRTGVDLEVTFPSEGTAYEIGQVSLVKGAQHPDTARTFIDWALTVESQEIAALVDVFTLPTNPDAVVPAGAVGLGEVQLADGFSPQLAEDLRASDFAERFASEVREGQEAPG